MKWSKTTWIILISSMLLWITGSYIIHLKELNSYFNIPLLLFCILVNHVATMKDAKLNKDVQK